MSNSMTFRELFQRTYERVSASFNQHPQCGGDDEFLDMPIEEFLHPAGDGYALLIGVERYSNVSPAIGSLKDVENQQSVLLLPNGWKPQHIRVLVNEQATEAEILSGISWLVSGRTTDDSLFLHFSGHGSWVRTEAGWETCLCCYDFAQRGPVASGAITSSTFNSALSKRADGTKLWAFIDSCFAGGMANEPLPELPPGLPPTIREFLNIEDS